MNEVLAPGRCSALMSVMVVSLTYSAERRVSLRGLFAGSPMFGVKVYRFGAPRKFSVRSIGSTDGKSASYC